MKKTCKSEGYKKKVALLKAMAHPVRLAILEKLYGRAMTACEIAGLFESDRTTVSKHLALLKSTGIIGCRKEGRHIYYFLNVPCVLDILPCIERVLTERGGQGLEAGNCCRPDKTNSMECVEKPQNKNQGGISS
jgi:ArsR family transcriptional regulator